MGEVTGTPDRDVLSGTPEADVLNGLDGADDLFGLDGDDTLDGGAGGDLLDGGNGNDTLRGGSGDDVLVGGSGDDIVDGGDGYDLASFRDALSGVYVYLWDRNPRDHGQGRDTLIGIEGVEGSAFNDLLVGDEGNNRLLGGSGNDVLAGRRGTDDLRGGAGNDLYVFEDGSEHDSYEITDSSGYDTVRFGPSGDSTLTLFAGDTGIERVEIAIGLSLETSPAVTYYNTVSIDARQVQNGLTIIGSLGPNVLLGTAFDDQISALFGTDTLTGGLGRDRLSGGEGLDTFSDTLAGLNGDTIVDLTFGERIVFTNADIATFAFQLSGTTLSYSGGSLTLTAPIPGRLVASAAPGGGVQLTITSSLLPPMPAAPGPPNTSRAPAAPDDRPERPEYVVESGTYRYWQLNPQESGSFLFNYGTLTNRGTIFLEVGVNNVYGVELASYLGNLANTGTIVLHDQRSLSYPTNAIRQLTNSFGGGSYSNSGIIHIQSDHGDATFLTTYQVAPTVTNSGLVAIYAPEGMGAGIILPNEGTIVNGASGRILVEAREAYAIYTGSGTVTNAGTIEVRAHGEYPGVGITVEYVGNVTNSGTIIADTAVLMNGTLTNSGRLVGLVWSDEFLTFNNQAGGRLEGDLIGGVSQSQFADVITNAGVITGDVLLRFGNDSFANTGSGRVEGVVDLGEGNDRYTGGIGVDRVTGDNGDDTIDGGGGNDLLLGGTGNDRLSGGEGNDGLYGEAGNDVIVTQGGDVVRGGNGNDRVELGDLTFRSVAGGAGFDTLVLPNGPMTIDLTSVLASGRVSGFEAISLRPLQHLIIRADDAASKAFADDLRILADPSDLITLVGYWSAATGVHLDGVNYTHYSSGQISILIPSDVPVALTLNAPAGSSLAPIAGGELPLVPGAAAGLDLTPTDFIVTNYGVSGTLLIDEGERWLTAGSSPIAFALNDSATINNFGSLIASNLQGSRATAVILDYLSTRVTNSGTIVAESVGERSVIDGKTQLRGSSAVTASYVTNSGVIEAWSGSGAAAALGEVRVTLAGNGFAEHIELLNSAYFVTNSGIISAESISGFAIGIASAIDIENAGSIRASAATGAVALQVDRSLVNRANGVIVADAAEGATATAVRVVYSTNWAFGGITNEGVIAGRVAIDAGFVNGPITVNNSGSISGALQMSGWGDRIVNSGQINGRVDLFGGADHYDGSRSGAAQEVWGGLDNDVLVGGRANDILVGGSGADTLSGGSGRDTFIDWARSWQGDVITDFSIGDRIVVTEVVDDFTYQLVGNRLNFTGGWLTLSAPLTGTLVVSAAPEGGYQFTLERQQYAHQDFNGDGRSDLLLQSSTGAISVWRGQEAGSLVEVQGLSANALDTSWRVAGLGDFNGDGRDDILWRHSSGTIGQWSGQSGQFTNNSGVAANPVDTSWNVAGIADYNGDGRDDILWRHASGEIGQWLAATNGSFANNGGAAANLVDPSWSVVASGDFNGDGRADILWRHSSGVYAEWQGSASGRLVNNGQVLQGANGSIVGSGDFNGDGRDDVLMRDAASGRISLRLGQGSGQFTDYAPSSQVSDMNWKIVAIGDYNADGFADLVWQHNSGATARWLGTSTGDFINNGAGGTVPAGWAVQSPGLWLI